MTSADNNDGTGGADHLHDPVLALGDGTRVTRGPKPLGTGGQGSVWALDERADLVAKIYNSAPDDAQLRRLAAMLRADPLAGEQLAPGQPPMLVWPVDLVVAGGRPVGYGMPLLDPAVHTPLNGLLQKHARLRRFEGRAHWKFLLGVASNLAYMTAELHQQRFVVGDLSSANAVVDPNGFVTFLDCDSFAFTDTLTGESFGSDVFTDDYAGPERYSGEAPTRHSDDFALAVLIYQLLSAGNHPFDGAPLQGLAEATRKDNIQTGTSFLVHPARVKTPAQLLPPEVLPPRLVELARRAFGPGIQDPRRRPSSAAWLEALDEARSAVVRCADVPEHHHSGHLTVCPWCTRRANGHSDPFVASQGRPSAGGRAAGASTSAAASRTASTGPSRAASTTASTGPSRAASASASRPGPSGPPPRPGWAPPRSGPAGASRPAGPPPSAPPPTPPTPPKPSSNAGPKANTTTTGPSGSDDKAKPTPAPLTKGEIAIGCGAVVLLIGIVVALVWGAISLVQALIN
ncbi:protein kinase [Streptomyces sp. NPDC058548]|uniref:protein kinase n=1 Tax=Streptomyces sp. NPDC058548 TaxID=3346545 RepID=UPI003659C53E